MSDQKKLSAREYLKQLEVLDMQINDDIRQKPGNWLAQYKGIAEGSEQHRAILKRAM